MGWGSQQVRGENRLNPQDDFKSQLCSTELYLTPAKLEHRRVRKRQAQGESQGGNEGPRTSGFIC